jgi:hypothetical protein
MAAAAQLDSHLPASRLARRRYAAVVVLISLILMGAAALLQVRINTLRPELEATDSGLVLSVPIIRRLSLGYTGLAADVYWTNAVQYFGARWRLKLKSYPALAPLLNVAYDLDPDMTQAAEYGSMLLADVPPLGAGQPKAAVALLTKAIVRHPEQWRLYFDLGFVYALNLHDRRAAARAFLEGSRVPHANPVLKTLAAVYFSKASEIPIARALFEDEYQSSPSPAVRQNALDHLQALRAEEDISQLQRIAGHYTQATGHPPQSWHALIAAGYLRAIPLDPQGHAYLMLPGGRFGLSPETKIASFGK